MIAFIADRESRVEKAVCLRLFISGSYIIFYYIYV